MFILIIELEESENDKSYYSTSIHLHITNPENPTHNKNIENPSPFLSKQK